MVSEKVTGATGDSVEVTEVFTNVCGSVVNKGGGRGGFFEAIFNRINLLEYYTPNLQYSASFFVHCSS